MWDAKSKPTNLLTFRSGGWVLVLTGALAVLIVLVVLVPALQRLRDRPPGDGRNPASYGFDLSVCLVDRERIVAGQFHRDLLEALVEPPRMAGSEVATRNAEQRGKYLVSNDRVIGVAIGGESRAYPLDVLELHEIVNDTLGGRAIAVTYNPLCDSVVVFDREVGGEVLEFGVSGLLFNSNLLMYDRRPGDHGESLWSQLQRRAITGPAAAEARELDVLPADLTHWGDWLERHPETTVIEPVPEMADRYKETSYASYFLADRLVFPVEPIAPVDRRPLMARCVIVLGDGGPRVYPFPVIAANVDAAGTWTDERDGQPIVFRYARDPEVVTVTRGASGDPAPVVYCLWFAWYAMDPDCAVAEER